MLMKKWKKEKTHTLLERPIFSVSDIECYHPEKNVSHTFFRLSTCDWINIVAIDDEGRYVMVRQHRLGTDEITVETVGGLVDPKEEPVKAAKRELLEETGFSSDRIYHLKTMTVNPAIMDNRLHIYYAENCRPTSQQNLDKAEDIEIVLLKKDELLDMIRSGEIDHSIVITALSLFWLSEHNSDTVTL